MLPTAVDDLANLTNTSSEIIIYPFKLLPPDKQKEFLYGAYDDEERLLNLIKSQP